MSDSDDLDYLLLDDCYDVFLCQLSLLFAKEDFFFEQLSDAEKLRAERFKFAIHRSRFIASHGFVRTVLARYLNTDAAVITYTKGQQGKPYLAGAHHDKLQFNLSHTEDIALLAVSRRVEIGVDIECHKRRTDWQGIVKRFFTASEQKVLFLLPEAQQREAFFELWTRKEAYMKVLGTGLSLAPTEFSLTVPPQKPALVKHHSSKFQALESISFSSIKMPQQWQHYYATLAVAGNSCNYRLYHF